MVAAAAVDRHLPMPKPPLSADRLDLARRLLWCAILFSLTVPAMIAVDGLMRSGRTSAPLAAWVRPLGGPALALVPAGQPLRRFGGEAASAPHAVSPWLGGFDPDPARLTLCSPRSAREPAKIQNETGAP